MQARVWGVWVEITDSLTTQSTTQPNCLLQNAWTYSRTEMQTHLFVVNLQKRCFQHEIRVRFALLQQLEQVQKRPKDEPVPFIGRIRFAADEQLRRTRERMRFAGARLAVTEGRAAEALDGHLDDALDARVLQHIVLCGARLEDHIVAEEFGLLAAGRSARNAIALRHVEEGED